MPRDNNGNYSLPAGNPVVAGTTITTLWANPTMADLGNEITNSLSRNGEGGMLVPFQNIDGTVSFPGITWTSEIRSGFYRADNADFRSTVNGVDSMRWTSDGVQLWNNIDSRWEDIATTQDSGETVKEAVEVEAGQTIIAPTVLFDSVIVVIDGNAQSESSGAYSVNVDTQLITMSEAFEGDETVELWLGDIAFASSFSASQVSSVFTRIGDVVAEDNDYTSSQVYFDNSLTTAWPVDDAQSALELAYYNIQFLAASLALKGVWDADLNSPDLLTIPKLNGDYWIVNVEGSTALPVFPGAPAIILPWLVSDRALYIDDGASTGFAQLRPDTGTVTSVFGRVGAVTAVFNDYSGDLVSFNNATSNLNSTNVQDAIVEVNGKIGSGGGGDVTSVFGRTGAVLSQASDYDAVEVDFNPAATPAWPVSNVQAALNSAYSSISFLSGSILLKGVWDANANVPAISAEQKISGDYWIVSVEGNTGLAKYPSAPAFDLPWQVLDRVLWIDDSGGSGFAQLRPEAGEYLLLTGGTMLGAINGVSPTQPAHLTRKDYVDDLDAQNLKLTGGTMLGQINGVVPVDAANLVRKDYVDAQSETGTDYIKAGNSFQCWGRTGTILPGENFLVVFPLPASGGFSNADYAGQCTYYGAGAGGDAPSVLNNNTFQMTVWNNSDSARTIGWTAVGES